MEMIVGPFRRSPREIFEGDIPKLPNIHVQDINKNSRQHGLHESRREREPPASLLYNFYKVVISYLQPYAVL